MMNLLLTSIIFLAIGCATIVKSPTQEVIFTGGPENGEIKINTPDGVQSFNGETGTFVITRSEYNIPIEVTCNGITQKGLWPSRFGAGWGFFGNWIFLPGWLIGVLVDVNHSQAYNARSPFNIGHLCETEVKNQATSPLK